MPKKFEEIRLAVLDSLREKYPDMSDKELERRSYVIASTVYYKRK